MRNYSPIYLIFAFLAVSVVSKAQHGGLYKHSEACELMLAACEKKIAKEDTVQALVLCKEAFIEAVQSNDANLIIRVKLFELRVLSDNLDFTGGIDAALTSCRFSEKAYDDLKLLAYINSMRFFEDFDVPEVGIDYIDKALAIKNEDITLRSYLLALKSTNLIKLKRKDEAQNALKDYIEFTKQHGLHNKWIEACQLLGIIQNEMKNYDEAIKSFKEMNMVAGWKADKRLLAISANNIALCQQKINEKNAAEYNFLDAIVTCPQTAKEFPDILLNYAYYLKEEKRNDQAIEYAIKARDVAVVNNNTRAFVKSNIIHAALLNQSEQTNEAITITKEMAEVCSRFQMDDLRLDALELLKICYSKTNNRDSERSILAQINSLNTKTTQEDKERVEKQTGKRLLIEQIRKNIESYYASVEQRRLEFDKRQLDILNQQQEKDLMAVEQQLVKSEVERSRIEKEKVKRDLELLQVSLNNQQQENAIIELESAKSSQMLKLTQLELDKQGETSKLLLAEKQNKMLTLETVANEEKLKRENTIKKISYFIGLLCLAALIGAALIIRNFRKWNRAMKSKNVELKIKTDDIHKSITSASYFQGSLAADTATLNKYLKNSFVFYKPLDIVSGDLPFVSNIDDCIYISAIDCIGHGVPAALLSFTGYYNLKQILELHPKADLGEILTMLNDQITSSLRSKTDESLFHAGMDISIIRIDKKNNTLDFAGAKSPLLICTPDEITTIRPSPYSVGDLNPGLHPTYKSHTFTIDPEARYIIMSDGYCDQMGGETGTKLFSKKSLAKLLKTFYSKNINELNQALKTEHENWKGSTEQTDDILMIGFQI